MRHIWSEFKKDPDDKRYSNRVCSRCGLNNLKAGSCRMLVNVYSRGGRVWPTSAPMPECVDWNAENKKTID